MSRYLSIGSRLTGWNAVKSRAQQLKLDLTDEEIKDATAKVKAMADLRDQSMEDVDSILRVYHSGLQEGHDVTKPAVFQQLLEQHKAAAAPSA
jgi:homocitrate synthase